MNSKSKIKRVTYVVRGCVLGGDAEPDYVFALDTGGDHVQLARDVDFGQQLLCQFVVAAQTEANQTHLEMQHFMLSRINLEIG